MYSYILLAVSLLVSNINICAFMPFDFCGNFYLYYLRHFIYIMKKVLFCKGNEITSLS